MRKLEFLTYTCCLHIAGGTESSSTRGDAAAAGDYFAAATRCSLGLCQPPTTPPIHSCSVHLPAARPTATASWPARLVSLWQVSTYHGCYLTKIHFNDAMGVIHVLYCHCRKPLKLKTFQATLAQIWVSAFRPKHCWL